jgi:hypothetical protein
MQPTESFLDDSSAPARPSLPKWPFILGDAVLVSAALAVWASQAQLSALELLFCLGAVALGAILFAAPFALEYLAQVKQQQGEAAPLPGLDATRLAAIEADMRRQVRAAMEALEQAARANSALEGSARRFETRLAPLVEIQKNLETAAAKINEAAAHPSSREPLPLPREFERLRQEQMENFKSSDAKLMALAQSLAALATRVESLSAPPSERKPRGTGSLLEKAMATAQSAGESPAMSGIIQTSPRRPRKTKSPIDPAIQPPAEVAPSEAEIPVPAATTSPATTEREGWDSLAAGKFDQVTANGEAAPEISSVTAVAVATPEVAIAAPVATVEIPSPTVSAHAKAELLRANDESTGTSAVVEQSQGELLAGAVESIRRRRATKQPLIAASESAALVARVLIGIGNKPYVRGEGPGLSNDKGVPMEFVEIGKWQWVAPFAAKAPITLRLLKNDEIPAKGGPIVLNPGQSIEVSPEFPA